MVNRHGPERPIDCRQEAGLSDPSRGNPRDTPGVLAILAALSRQRLIAVGLFYQRRGKAAPRQL